MTLPFLTGALSFAGNTGPRPADCDNAGIAKSSATAIEKFLMDVFVYTVSSQTAMIIFLITGLFQFFTAAHAQDMQFIGGDILYQPTVSAEHQRVSVIDEQKILLGAPIHKAEEFTSAVFLRAVRSDTGEPLKFSDRNIDIPEEFGSAELGLSFIRGPKNGKRYGATVSYGGAGPRLFRADDPPIVTANAFYDLPQGDGRAFIFFMMYSNNRSFLNNVPLPGLAYAMNGPRSRLLLGMPFVFWMWRPEPVYLTSFVSPFAASVESGYRVWGPLQFFGGANWLPKSYSNLVIDGSDDRLIYERKEASAGVRLSLNRETSISMAYVYAFDRKFYLGESFNDPTSASIHLADGPGVQLKAKAAF